MKEAAISNIIFLDIDGCLTSVDDGTYFNPDPACYHVSDKILARVIALCKTKNAGIVISSNWRRYEPNGTWKNQYGEYKNPLPSLKKKLGDLYIGTLPKDRHITKSQALILWIQESCYAGDFVIFDDDLREGFQDAIEYDIMNHFVLVDSQHGITEDNIKEAFEIFKRGDPWKTL